MISEQTNSKLKFQITKDKLIWRAFSHTPCTVVSGFTRNELPISSENFSDQKRERGSAGANNYWSETNGHIKLPPDVYLSE